MVLVNIPDEFIEKSYSIALRLKKWDKNLSILILGHRDGDGVSAISVLYQGLKALGFKDLHIEVLLDPNINRLKEILNEDHYDYLISGDMGSIFEGVLDDLVIDYIIADHHPNKTGEYGEHQLNPCEFGMNDEIDCSGSTIALLIFLHIFPDSFWDTNIGKLILCYALSGAISDFQFKNGIVISLNKYVLDFAVNHGAVSLEKDICLFGRGMYPIYITLNRSGIEIFKDINFCKRITDFLFEIYEDRDLRRIIDLTHEEKEELIESITIHLLSIDIPEDEITNILNELVNFVYDLEGLKGWACTFLPDGRETLDAREILHRVNYVCRRGKSNLAVKLLNEKKIDNEVWEVIESYHKMGDHEVGQALQLYESGEIALKSWNDNKIIMADFTGSIFYDGVGVIAGVIMKKYRDIEIMLSYCEIENDGGIVKLSVRAREDVWDLIEKQNENLADAKKVYSTIQKKYPKKMMGFGGHRWACSGRMKKDIVPDFFDEMIKYYKKLK